MIALLAVPETNPDWGKAAPVGLFVLLAFVVVCFFLFRSMNRRIKSIPPSFAKQTKPSADAASDVADQRLGTADPEIPKVEFVDPSTQTRPRLGTPEEVLELQKQKHAEKVRKAKARAKRK